MKYLFPIVYVLISSHISLADDIYFNSGYIFKNVFVKDTIDRRINVVVDDSLRSFPLSTVFQIVKREYDPTGKMVIENITPLKTMNDLPGKNDLPAKNVNYEYRNMKFLPLAGVAFVLAYRHYDMTDTDDGDAKTTNIALGTIFLLAGIADVWISFTPVEITGTSESLSLSIHF